MPNPSPYKILDDAREAAILEEQEQRELAIVREATPLWALNPAATAEKHKAADAACGREWTCQCGACRQIRTEDADWEAVFARKADRATAFAADVKARIHQREVSQGVRIAEAAMRLGSPWSAWQAQQARADAARAVRLTIEVTSMTAMLDRINSRRHQS